MRWVLLCAMLACSGPRTERVSVDPVALPASPQPVTSGALAPPAPFSAGTYELDVGATKPYFEAHFAKLPPDEQQAGQMMIEMLLKMHATLTLAQDGRATMKARFDGHDEEGEREKKGTWRREGEDLVLTSDGKDMRCTPDGARLLCREREDETMVFVRH